MTFAFSNTALLPLSLSANGTTNTTNTTEVANYLNTCIFLSGAEVEGCRLANRQIPVEDEPKK